MRLTYFETTYFIVMDRSPSKIVKIAQKFQGLISKTRRIQKYFWKISAASRYSEASQSREVSHLKHPKSFQLYLQNKSVDFLQILSVYYTWLDSNTIWMPQPGEFFSPQKLHKLEKNSVFECSFRVFTLTLQKKLWWSSCCLWWFF